MHEAMNYVKTVFFGIQRCCRYLYTEIYFWPGGLINKESDLINYIVACILVNNEHEFNPLNMRLW